MIINTKFSSSVITCNSISNIIIIVLQSSDVYDSAKQSSDYLGFTKEEPFNCFVGPTKFFGLDNFLSNIYQIVMSKVERVVSRICFKVAP